MKTKVLLILCAVIIATPVLAEKPEWTGKGQPAAEQKQTHKTAKEAKQEMGAEQVKSRETMKKDKPDQAGKSKEMEKQQNRNMEQVQKQTGTGSETGKQSKEKKKKWWKFWGE